MEALRREIDKPEILQMPRKLYLKSGAEQWFKVTALSTLYDILHQFTESRVRYRLVAGNTGTGTKKIQTKIYCFSYPLQ